MSEQFKPTGKHKKKIIVLIVAGIVLLIAGILATPGKYEHGGHEHHPLVEPVNKVAAAEHGHGDAHKADAHGGHGEEAHGDHGHGSAHGNGAHEEHGPKRNHDHPLKLTTLATALMVGGFYFTCIALFGVFFIAVGYIANAGWYVAVKRVAETFYMFLPIAGVVMVIVGIMSAMGITYWRWSDVDLSADHLLSGKTAILNSPVLIGTMVLFFAVWTLLAHMIRKYSLMEDQDSLGSLTYHKKSITISAIFLPFFGLSFSLAAFEWLMSLEPHWFSTIYAVYCFAGLFVLGTTTLMLISINLRENGFLPQFNGEHRHDLGKFMFAFSIFWAYIWVSQYLLIWYANIPEETLYYVPRQDHYPLLFYGNLVINFAVPFLAFMTRDGKRKEDWIKLVASVLLFGRFLDIFLLVAPGMLGDQWGIGAILASAGMVCLLGGAFLAVVYRGLSKAPLVPKNHPYLKESLTYDTGI